MRTPGSFGGPLLLLLLLLCHVLCPSTASDAYIRSVCAKAEISSDCVAILEGEPGILGADLPGFTRIALQLSLRNVTYTSSLVRRLLNRSDLGHLERHAFAYCNDVCPVIINTLQMGLKAIDAGDFDMAAESAESCASQVKECEDLFKSSGLASPIKQEDELQFKLCITATELAVQLHELHPVQVPEPPTSSPLHPVPVQRHEPPISSSFLPVRFIHTNRKSYSCIFHHLIRS